LDLYLAFAARTGVDSEMTFIGAVSEDETRTRRQRLLEPCASALEEYAPQRPSELSAVVEVWRKRRGARVLVGWMGAPDDAPVLPTSDLLQRAIADVRERLRPS